MLMPTLKSESKIKLKVYLTISNILVEYGVIISQIFVVSRRNIITNIVITLTPSISFVLTLFSMLFLLKWNVSVLQYEKDLARDPKLDKNHDWDLEKNLVKDLDQHVETDLETDLEKATRGREVEEKLGQNLEQEQMA